MLIDVLCVSCLPMLRIERKLNPRRNKALRAVVGSLMVIAAADGRRK